MCITEHAIREINPLIDLFGSVRGFMEEAMVVRHWFWLVVSFSSIFGVSPSDFSFSSGTASRVWFTAYIWIACFTYSLSFTFFLCSLEYFFYDLFLVFNIFLTFGKKIP
jgi:hypothetical protein